MLLSLLVMNVTCYVPKQFIELLVSRIGWISNKKLGLTGTISWGGWHLLPEYQLFSFQIVCMRTNLSTLFAVKITDNHIRAPRVAKTIRASTAQIWGNGCPSFGTLKNAGEGMWLLSPQAPSLPSPCTLYEKTRLSIILWLFSD